METDGCSGAGVSYEDLYGTVPAFFFGLDHVSRCG